jgi:hypothetical protein
VNNPARRNRQLHALTIALGVLPAASLVAGALTDGLGAGAFAAAGISAVVGMFLAETAFVRAGQSVPLS